MCCPSPTRQIWFSSVHTCVFFVLIALHFFRWRVTSLLVFIESNAGSVTHLVSNEQPLAIVPIAPKLEQYNSQPCLVQSPLYSNVHSHGDVPLSKSQSYAQDLDNKTNHVDDLHLDPVEIREGHMLTNIMEKRKQENNDLTEQDKENILLSASRLKILRDTTMIESALDLDSLDDSSIGANSQAGLMKVVV